MEQEVAHVKRLCVMHLHCRMIMVEAMPHLTCVGHTVDELLEILEDFAKAGFRNVMALRGDPQRRESFPSGCGWPSYGSDLVALIKKIFRILSLVWVDTRNIQKRRCTHRFD